jgi:DivIVA domain-containing protein
MGFEFARTNPKKIGYRPQDVDAFIERARAAFNDVESGEVVSVRDAQFELEKGGYSVSSVDAALDRLEDTFTARKLQRLATIHGREQLADRLNEIKVSLVGRIERPKNQRFSNTGFIYRGYSRKEVDAFVEAVGDHIENQEKMSVDVARQALFTPKRGGYAENQVDLFIDRVVELLQIEKVL